MKKTQLLGHIIWYKGQMGPIRKIFGPHPAIAALERLCNDIPGYDVDDNTVIGCFRNQIIKTGAASYIVLHDILKQLFPYSGNISLIIAQSLENGRFLGTLKYFKMKLNPEIQAFCRQLKNPSKGLGLSDDEQEAVLLLHNCFNTVPDKQDVGKIKLEFSMAKDILYTLHFFKRLTKENVQRVRGYSDYNSIVILCNISKGIREFSNRDNIRIMADCYEEILACSDVNCLKAIQSAFFYSAKKTPHLVDTIRVILSYNKSLKNTGLAEVIKILCPLEMVTKENIQLLTTHSHHKVLLEILRTLDSIERKNIIICNQLKNHPDWLLLLLEISEVLVKPDMFAGHSILSICYKPNLTYEHLVNVRDLLQSVSKKTLTHIQNDYSFFLQIIVSSQLSPRPATKEQIETFAMLLTLNSETTHPDAKTPSLNSAAFFSGFRDNRQTDSQSQQLCDERFDLVL